MSADKAAERKEFETWYSDNYRHIAANKSWVERAWAAYEAGRSSLESENAALKKELQEFKTAGCEWVAERCQLELKLSAAESENARLREALRKYAVEDGGAEMWQHCRICLANSYFDLPSKCVILVHKSDCLLARL